MAAATCDQPPPPTVGCSTRPTGPPKCDPTCYLPPAFMTFTHLWGVLARAFADLTAKDPRPFCAAVHTRSPTHTFEPLRATCVTRPGFPGG